MADKHLIDEIIDVSLSMFRKNFFGVYHGSISARIGIGSFMINTKEAIFDEMTEESLITLDREKIDYRWKIASIDVHIHNEIYHQIPHAKYIAYTMPPYITSYGLSNDTLTPKDYFGDKFFGEVAIYDPGNFSDWYERAPYELASFFKSSSVNLIVVKGYGVVAYDRDLIQIAKNIAILENSARLLSLSS